MSQLYPPPGYVTKCHQRNNIGLYDHPCILLDYQAFHILGLVNEVIGQREGELFVGGLPWYHKHGISLHMIKVG